MTLLDRFHYWVKSRPLEIAFYDYDRRRAWTWSECALLVETMCAKMTAAERGRPVLVFAAHAIQFPTALIACWRRGCLPLLVPEDITASELRELVRECGAENTFAIGRDVGNAKLKDLAKAANLDLHTFGDDVRSSSECEIPPTAVDSGSPALALMTSGTTSRPKIIVFSHEELRASADIELKNGFTAKAIANLRPPFTSGGVNTLWPALALGAAHVFSERVRTTPIARFLAEFIRDVEERLAIDLVVLSPAYLETLALSFDDNETLERPLSLYFGGMRLREETVRRLVRFGFHPTMRYGMTEIGHCLSRVPTFKTESSAKRAPNGVGSPYEGFDVFVVDGRVAVRSPGVASSRFRDGQLEALHQGVFVTEDKGALSESGEILLHGREHEAIVVRGFRFHRSEVEEVLLKTGLVQDVRVVAFENDRGVQVAACLLGRESKAVEEKLRLFCQEKISSFKRPRVYIWMTEWPMGPNGKIDILKLKTAAQIEDQRISDDENSESD